MVIKRKPCPAKKFAKSIQTSEKNHSSTSIKSVPYYRNLFKANKLKPDDIRSLEDLRFSAFLPPRRIFG